MGKPVSAAQPPSRAPARGGARAGAAASLLTSAPGRRHGRLDRPAHPLHELRVRGLQHVLRRDHGVDHDLHAGPAGVQEVLALAGHDPASAVDRQRHDPRLRALGHGEGALLEVEQETVPAAGALREDKDGGSLLEGADALPERLQLRPSVLALDGEGLGRLHREAHAGDLKDLRLRDKLEWVGEVEQREDVHEGLVVRDKDGRLISGGQVLAAAHPGGEERPSQKLAPPLDQAVRELPLVRVPPLDNGQCHRYCWDKEDPQGIQAQDERERPDHRYRPGTPPPLRGRHKLLQVALLLLPGGGAPPGGKGARHAAPRPRTHLLDRMRQSPSTRNARPSGHMRPQAANPDQDGTGYQSKKRPAPPPHGAAL
mmetsp:Transcript_115404/g.359440  ORF Transcript_115404/g.359440 Transcript_115404/m.359440 type:complete len:370 (-) Transcript_115404:22-1131(-)